MIFQTKYSDDQFIQLLKARNTDAFSNLYDSYSEALYGVIFRIIGDEENAQDALQDSFIKIWKNLDSFNSSKGRLFTWMLNIARNTALDLYRTSQNSSDAKSRPPENSINEFDSKNNITETIDHTGLKELVNKLRPEYLVLINLAYFKGFTHQEISKETGLTPETVKTRIRSAFSQLRDILKTK